MYVCYYASYLFSLSLKAFILAFRLSRPGLTQATGPRPQPETVASC